MKYRFLMLLAVAGVLAACVKEETGTSASGEKGKVVAQFGVGLSDVKTTLGPLEGTKRKIFWSEGDSISINGLVSNPLSAEAAGSVTAVFDFTESFSTPCNVLYPASMYKDESTITLPAVQTYKADGFANDTYPMAALSAVKTGATLAPLCAMIKLPIKLEAGNTPDSDKISTIVFSGNAGEQVSGDFTIDYAAATLTPAGVEEADCFVTLNVGKSLSAEPLPAVLVVPAGTYASGFSVRVTDVAGHYMDMSKDVSFTLEAGHLYVMPEFEFVPTGTQLGIEISSAAELIAFAQNYNSKAIEEGLVATLTQDITFDETTSAAFNATGGIGLKVDAGDAEDHYYNGLFNGNGKTISGLQATVPLFRATGSAGIVKDLTLDGSCSFTFTHPNTKEGMFGSMVGYHKGKLENITVAADVALAEKKEISQMTTLGGLVGRATTGTLSACTYSGLISTPAGFAGTKKLLIGGLVGRFSNEGSVKESYFKGAISNEAQITSTDTTNPYIVIGGVVGFVDGGASVESCNTTADHAEVASAYSGGNGIIVNKTTVAYNSAVGGIAGEVNNGTVSYCDNASTIFNTVFKVGADGSRYMRTGGIVGKNDAGGIVSNCNNLGSVQHRSNPKLQSMGGIVGWNAGMVNACVNSAAVNQMTSGSGQKIKAGRLVKLGGVIGENLAGALVYDLHNTANIQISSMEDGTASEVTMGGVIGWNGADIDGGEAKTISNSGQVYLSPTFANQFLGYEIGGVVGCSQASVSNVWNSGYVYVRWNSEANVASKFCVGGVVGKLAGTADLVLSGCDNKHTDGNEGKVLFLAGPNNGNNVGGILGYSETNVALTACENNGLVTSQLFSVLDSKDEDNPYNVNGCLGGILGALASGKTASFTQCVNNGEVFYDNNGKGGTENTTVGRYTNTYAGGILAKGDGVSFDSCINNGYVHAGNAIKHNGTACFTGGIVAYLSGASSITDCSNSAKVDNDQFVNSSSVTSNAFTGGIVGRAVGASGAEISISGCVHNTQNLGPRRGIIGGIVGYGKYVSIDNCNVDAINFTGSAYIIGGIAGQVDYGSISNSSWTGNSIVSSQVLANMGGGIAGQLTATTVDACSSYLTALMKKVDPVTFATGGAIVGTVAASEQGATTIQNCHYKAEINDEASKIAGAGAFTDGGGNVADL